MRSPKDFFSPLAAGAPEPLREIPFRPSRMIHFFPPHLDKVTAKLPDIAPKVDILLGNLEDAIPMESKEDARDGLVRVGKEMDLGDTQLWTRVNSLDSPWALDDLDHPGHRDRRPSRRDHDPQGRGPRGHPLRRPSAGAARGQGGPHPSPDGARHPRDRPGGGQRGGDLPGLTADAGAQPRSRPTWPPTAG